ncbi:MAG: hypothetical protein U1A78_33015 [Polyangia bacterium]
MSRGTARTVQGVLGVAGLLLSVTCARAEVGEKAGTKGAGAKSGEKLDMTTKPSAEKGEKSNPGEAGASLTLTMDPAVVARGGDVTAQLVLRNGGSASLWVNQRLLVNTEHAPAEAREVTLEVTGPDGKKLPFLEKIRAGAAEAKHFKELKPGAEKGIKLELSRYFDFSQPGTYRVTAVYQDGNKAAPKVPAGAAPLSATLRSNTLEITVK